MVALDSPRGFAFEANALASLAFEPKKSIAVCFFMSGMLAEINKTCKRNLTFLQATNNQLRVKMKRC
jgi:hypothetical protein